MDQGTSINRVAVFISGFVLAILVSSFYSLGPLTALFIIILALLITLGERVWSGEVSGEVFVLTLFLLAFGLGAMRYEVKDYHELQVPAPAGVVVSEPAERENTTRFTLLSDNGERVLVNTDLYSPVQYGDRVEIADGKLERPGIIEDEDSGRPFDYGAYLAKDDIYYTWSFAHVEVVSSGHGSRVKQALFALKHGFVSRARAIWPEPESSLLAGLVVAGKGTLPAGILEEFRRAGVIHIVVLSGYNITIIADFLRKFFATLFLRLRAPGGLQTATGASVLGILLFVLMTGAEATVVRAALMVLVVIMAKMFGRAYSAPRALAGAAFLMLIHNPKILVFDPSFQLSFLATLALIYISPVVDRYLSRLPARWGFRTMVSTTIATQVLVLPFLVYSVGNLSLVSLPANVLILLFIPITMLMGFVSVLLAYVSGILALPFSFIAHILLSWILGVSHVLSNLPLAYLTIPPFPFWVVVIIYIVLAFIVRRWRNSPPPPSNSN